jgi:phospho-N-acetylmuramoyl-pentapeptide-transferase
MIALLISGGVALIVSLVTTPILIRWLQAQGIGQQVREDGPQGHVTKAGTPTMGGITIVAGAIAGYAAGHLRAGAIYSRSGIIIALTTVAAGLVGLIDDWIGVRRERNLGLSKRAKIIGQLVVAGGFAFLAHDWAKISTVLSFTRQTAPHLWHMGVVVWVVWVVLVITGTSNAVNLTDGLDGLAAGSAAFAFSAFAIIGFWQFRHADIYGVQQALDRSLMAVALTGACAGFLWWNAAPARIFMGDTGSLAIGAAMAALALTMKLDLLLPVVGGLYVLETVSVMTQVATFRLFKRRVFRMAPIHHHFELGGWPETTVIIRFWILSGLCTALALGLFYADFLSLGRLD